MIIINKDKLDLIVFQTMLTVPEYMNLPDYYVKEICYKSLVKYLKESEV